MIHKMKEKACEQKKNHDNRENPQDANERTYRHLTQMVSKKINLNFTAIFINHMNTKAI